jgi:nucleoside-diphosphate-sugar epimerase
MAISNKRVLVVGGAGYVGGAVTDALLAKNVPFSVYDALLYEERYLKPVDFIFGDVRDTKKLATILPNYTHVIWLAAIVGDGACALNPEATVEINELAIKWLTENFNGRIVFTSTCSVYGSNDKDVTEEDAPRPLSLYAVTKVNAEKYLLQKNSFILRLGTAFGISDTYSRPRLDLLVNTLTSNAITKGHIMIFGGNQSRPNIHVKDIADLAVAGLDSPLKGIYNAATENFTVDEIGKMVVSLTGCELRYANQLKEDKRDYRVSFEKATAAGVLKLPTKYTVEYGIKEFIELMKSGRIKNDKDSRYSNVKYLSQNAL